MKTYPFYLAFTLLTFFSCSSTENTEENIEEPPVPGEYIVAERELELSLGEDTTIISEAETEKSSGERKFEKKMALIDSVKQVFEATKDDLYMFSLEYSGGSTNKWFHDSQFKIKYYDRYINAGYDAVEEFEFVFFENQVPVLKFHQYDGPDDQTKKVTERIENVEVWYMIRGYESPFQFESEKREKYFDTYNISSHTGIPFGEFEYDTKSRQYVYSKYETRTDDFGDEFQDGKEIRIDSLLYAHLYE